MRHVCLRRLPRYGWGFQSRIPIVSPGRALLLLDVTRSLLPFVVKFTPWEHNLGERLGGQNLTVTGVWQESRLRCSLGSDIKHNFDPQSG